MATEYLNFEEMFEQMEKERAEGIRIAMGPIRPICPNPQEGIKHDQGKARFDLVPPDALFEVVRVYNYGATLYGDRNWEKGILWGRVFAAICRHLYSWWRGEDHDPESGIHHLAHAAWGCLALLAYELRGMEAFDDRKKAE